MHVELIPPRRAPVPGRLEMEVLRVTDPNAPRFPPDPWMSTHGANGGVFPWKMGVSGHA